MKVLVTCAGALVVSLVVLAVGSAPVSSADNKRLNDSVVQNVATIQYRHECKTKLRINPQLRLAAEWHANDVLNNRSLDGDVGSDGSTVQVRAAAAGFVGTASETVAVNPALSITGVEILRQWYYRSDYMAIMANCDNSQIGVWSVNSLDRTVVVAVYGRPT